MEEVDLLINRQVSHGWEFVQMTSGATATAVIVIVVFRRIKSENAEAAELAEEASDPEPLSESESILELEGSLN